jgi:hypothetical protein
MLRQSCGCWRAGFDNGRSFPLPRPLSLGLTNSSYAIGLPLLDSLRHRSVLWLASEHRGLPPHIDAPFVLDISVTTSSIWILRKKFANR